MTDALPAIQPHEPPADPPLATVVYDQLRAIARNQLLGERAGHSLSATALVHEAFLRLRGDAVLAAEGRAVFVRAAAEAMRRILVEHARARGRVNRRAGVGRVPLDVIGGVADLETIDLEGSDRILAFDAAFRRLEVHEAGAADVVRFRFYAGLAVPETAAALGISERTVNNRWAYARAWLAREMQTPEC